MNVYVKNDNIKLLTGIELSILIALDYLKSNNEFYFSQSIIQDILFDEVSNDKRKIKNITDSIELLISKKIIKVNRKISTGKNATYVCDTNSICIDNEIDRYTYLSFDTFKATAKINVDMVKYLFAIASTFNSENRVGFKKISNICCEYDLMERTFNRYLNIFEKNNILYVYHHKTTKNLHGNIFTPINSYGEYFNKDTVDRVAKQYIEQFYENNNMHSDGTCKNVTFENGRSIKQRYNHFVNGRKYSQDIIKKLYYECMEYNKFYQDRYDRYNNSNDINRLIDLSVFDKFLNKT